MIVINLLKVKWGVYCFRRVSLTIICIHLISALIFSCCRFFLFASRKLEFIFTDIGCIQIIYIYLRFLVFLK